MRGSISAPHTGLSQALLVLKAGGERSTLRHHDTLEDALTYIKKVIKAETTVTVAKMYVQNDKFVPLQTHKVTPIDNCPCFRVNPLILLLRSTALR